MESLFFPIVSPAKLESFKSKWESWFVLTDEITDQKCPGKLKVEFSTRNGEMYALAPKTYFAFCKESDLSKDGRKGIPKSIPLTIRNFSDALYNTYNTQQKIKIDSLRLNREKTMTRSSLIRKSLSAIHCKLFVENDNITCSPLRKDQKFL